MVKIISRFRLILPVAGLTVALLFSSGCPSKSAGADVIASVDKETLSMDEFKANFTAAQWKALTNDQKKELVQQWVNMTLLAAEADKEGMADEKAIKLKIKYAEKKIKANALIASKLASQH